MIVVVVVVALLIHGCEASQTQSSLRDYSAKVYSLIGRSDALGQRLFKELRDGGGASNAASIQNSIESDLKTAESQLADTEALGVPSQMATAQRNLVLVMTMRTNGIRQIAANIPTALGSTTPQDGVNRLAVADAYLFGSDTVYKGYVGTEMAQALNAAGIPVGGNSSVQINSGQFVSDLGWLVPTNIAVSIGATLPTNVANQATPGLHGHSLNEVTVGALTLNTGVENDIRSTPAPTFELNITNGGDYREYDVECKVTVDGLSDEGVGTLTETVPGQTVDCPVKLPSPPTPGTYKVTATVEPVPGEKNTANNSLTFPVTFTNG